jgi:RNA polymerase sigma-70 factor (ECF subfamily)
MGAPDPKASANNALTAATRRPALVVSAALGADPGETGHDDAALLARIRDGDGPAFEAMFVAHYQTLYTFAYRLLGDQASAEDVVQDVFRRVWERRAAWAPHAGTQAYLIGATRNAALNVLRQDATAARTEARAVREDLRPGASAEAVPVTEALEAAELAADIAQAARRLPPRCQQVFLSRWRDGLTIAETARALGLAPKTVEMHMTKALGLIRQRLKRRRDL